MLLYSYFEGERGDTGRVPQIWDWKANAICLPDFTIYTGDQEQKS